VIRGRFKVFFTRVQADSLHRSDAAKMDGRQDCFVSQSPRTLAGQRWQAAQAAGQTAASKTSAKSQDLGCCGDGESQLRSRRAKRSETALPGDRKSGGKASASGPGSRDERHKAEVRQMKSEPSRDDSTLREKQVCSAKDQLRR
jgi:hypothetical protein